VPHNEFDSRRRRLGAEIASRKLDALVVSFAPNVRYLSGFTGSNGLLLLFPNEAILFTDPRYKMQSAQEVDCPVRICSGPILPVVLSIIQRKKVRKVGVEKSRISYESYEILRSKLPLRSSLEPVAGLIETYRMVKSEQELSLIRRSVITNSEAFRKTVARIRTGMRESDLAAELDHQMRRLGAEKPAFETIVAAGARSALPHARPSSTILEGNELLLIDMGATQGGYASDMTRMLFLGRPDRKVKGLYRAVLNAQLAAIDSVRPGVTAAHVDGAARRVLRSEKLDRAFVHSTGHGLGLEIHERPRIGKQEKSRLQTGMAITIEPGTYLEGYGGVRIEDTVLVTERGCEVLTPTSKDLLEI